MLRFATTFGLILSLLFNVNAIAVTSTVDISVLSNEIVSKRYLKELRYVPDDDVHSLARDSQYHKIWKKLIQTQAESVLGEQTNHDTNRIEQDRQQLDFNIAKLHVLDTGNALGLSSVHIPVIVNTYSG